jgi:hypothetical protein
MSACFIAVHAVHASNEHHAALGLYPQPNAHHPPPSRVEGRGSIFATSCLLPGCQPSHKPVYRHCLFVCCCSQALSTQTFQVLDEAAAVLSALHALHIPLALLVPAQSSKAVQGCLDETKMLDQFAAVVRQQLRVSHQAMAQRLVQHGMPVQPGQCNRGMPVQPG